MITVLLIVYLVHVGQVTVPTAWIVGGVSVIEQSSGRDK